MINYRNEDIEEVITQIVNKKEFKYSPFKAENFTQGNLPEI